MQFSLESSTRLSARGKFFVRSGSSVALRAVEYEPPAASGASSANGDGAEGAVAKAGAHGFVTLVTQPSRSEILEHAADAGAQVLLRQEPGRWARLTQARGRRRRSLIARMVADLDAALATWRGSVDLVGLTLQPGAATARTPVERRRLVSAANEVGRELKAKHSGLLLGWRAVWPWVGECPHELDFLEVEVSHAERRELREALAACHRRVGDRPLVVSGTPRGVDPLELVDVACERGVAGLIFNRHSLHLGADAVARTVADLDVSWPTVSVVVCAHNSESTLEECLSHCDRLEYPLAEIIVVDDGSTDGTAAIARAHPEVRLLSVRHGGLSVARNVGYRAARGELVAYLDADAYPPPEWLRYLALAALEPGAGGSGGPNVPPADESRSARLVALSPGGPAPSLRDELHATHVPGCNMAFWKDVLEEIGGFDPVLTSASDDLELGERVTETGRTIAYHPAALVWHHRRPGLRAYLRHQRGYGRTWATIERRHPDRVPPANAPDKLRRALGRTSAVGGGPAPLPIAYVSLLWRKHGLLELAHRWGLPVALPLAGTTPLGLVRRPLAVPGAAAVAAIAAVFVADAALAGSGNRLPDRRIVTRARLATYRLARPLAFRWGLVTGRRALRTVPPEWPPAPVAGPREAVAA